MDHWGYFGHLFWDFHLCAELVYKFLNQRGGIKGTPAFINQGDIFWLWDPIRNLASLLSTVNSYGGPSQWHRLSEKMPLLCTDFVMDFYIFHIPPPPKKKAYFLLEKGKVWNREKKPSRRWMGLLQIFDKSTSFRASTAPDRQCVWSRAPISLQTQYLRPFFKKTIFSPQD